METCCGYQYDRAQRSNYIPSDFQGSSRTHRTWREAPGSADLIDPSSGQTDFSGSQDRQVEKITLPRAPADVSEFNRVAAQDLHPDSGILTGFPFDRRREPSAPFETELPYLLGSIDPCPTAVTMEPFSTSVNEVPARLFATFTKICTKGRSTRRHRLGFRTDLHACLLVGASLQRRR